MDNARLQMFRDFDMDYFTLDKTGEDHYRDIWHLFQSWSSRDQFGTRSNKIQAQNTRSPPNWWLCALVFLFVECATGSFFHPTLEETPFNCLKKENASYREICYAPPPSLLSFFPNLPQKTHSWVFGSFYIHLLAFNHR